MLPPPPHLRPHTHTRPFHILPTLRQAEPERVFGWLGQRPATPAASAAAKPSDRPMHKVRVGVRVRVRVKVKVRVRVKVPLP